MKKILFISVVFIFFAGLFLTSCNSGPLCPAYPPSVYQGDNLQKSEGRSVNIEIIEIQDNNL
jgi:hypothetical protein